MGRTVRSFGVFLLAVAVEVVPAAAHGDVLGYWRFESGTAISASPYFWTWLDSSGRGHTAQSTDECSGSPVVFGPIVPETLAQNVGSMAFPRWYSRSDWVIVPDDNDFDFAATDSFTVEMWVNFGTYSDSVDHQIVKKGYYSSTPGWGFSYAASNSGIVFFLVDSGGIYLDARSDGPLNDGKWHHVAGVRSVTPLGGENLRLYVDGVLQTLDTTTSAPVARNLGSVEDLWIGGADQPYCYGGYLDELRISSGALAPSQFLRATPPAAAPAMSGSGYILAIAVLLGVAAVTLPRTARSTRRATLP